MSAFEKPAFPTFVESAQNRYENLWESLRKFEKRSANLNIGKCAICFSVITLENVFNVCNWKKGDQKLISHVTLQMKLEWLYQFLRVRKIDDGHELASENKFWVLENVFSAWESPVAPWPYKSQNEMKIWLFVLFNGTLKCTFLWKEPITILVSLFISFRIIRAVLMWTICKVSKKNFLKIKNIEKSYNITTVASWSNLCTVMETALLYSIYITVFHR